MPHRRTWNGPPPLRLHPRALNLTPKGEAAGWLELGLEVSERRVDRTQLQGRALSLSRALRQHQNQSRAVLLVAGADTRPAWPQKLHGDAPEEIPGADDHKCLQTLSDDRERQVASLPVREREALNVP